MLKEEFMNFLPKAKEPTNEEFEVISEVYACHPCIDAVRGKEQIATLWSVGGMRLMLDMLQTARQAAAIDDKIIRLRAEIDRLLVEYKSLKEGVI